MACIPDKENEALSASRAETEAAKEIQAISGTEAENENQAVSETEAANQNQTVSDNEEFSLTDLPDHVIIHILSYLDTDFLRYTASILSVLFRRLARSRVLWSKASLCYDDFEIWEDSIADKFLNDLKLTPYLHSLVISILMEQYDSRILPALIKTRCKIYQLTLRVNEYTPEVLMFLQRHPEIRELTLHDLFVDDNSGYCRGVAGVVASYAPSLVLLDLCQSHLMELPQLFPPHTAEEGPWSPATDCAMVPAGAEPFCPPEDEDAEEDTLDLRESEDRRAQTPRRGLLKLRYKPSPETDLDNEDITKNLESILRMYRHSLVNVRLDWPKTEVYQSLAQCHNLTSMAVTLPGDMCASFASAMKDMKSPPTTVYLGLRVPVKRDELTKALRALGDRGPPMEELELEVLPLSDGAAVAKGQTFVFPGFLSMSGLLQHRGLEKLVLTNVSPVGRAEMRQLASMAPVSLRRLEISHSSCSWHGAFLDCRNRADEELREALPGLQIDVFCNFFDDGYDAGFKEVHGCRCERWSGWGRRRGDRGGRRGRGSRGGRRGREGP